MLGIDPEVPVPLTMLDQVGYTPRLAMHLWDTYGEATAVSGDPVL